MIWLPRLQQVLRLHEKIIEQSGGTLGIRDVGLIESAILRASAEFGGIEAYSSISQKAAAVCCGLICNHGFIDGNKRIGVTVMLLILAKNDVVLKFTQKELVHLGLNVAQSVLTVKDIAGWIETHIIN